MAFEMDEEILENIVYHVTFPPKLPQNCPDEELTREIHAGLVQMTLDALTKYHELISDGSSQWHHMKNMLSKLINNLDVSQNQLKLDMEGMELGNVLSLYIRQQNAVVIIRKFNRKTIFEVFEAQAPSTEVMAVSGRLVRHYPGPAVQIPNAVASSPDFINEISRFLSSMHTEDLEDTKAGKAKPGVSKICHPVDPHYITQLFTAILRGFGQETDTLRFVKRIADEVSWDKQGLPWRRSPIWLLIRVTLQTSLDSANAYKEFMVYLHAYLLEHCSQEPNVSSFSSDMLFTMRAKVARRLHKLGDEAPQTVVRAAKHVSEHIENILFTRWNDIQSKTPQFAPLEFDRDKAQDQTLKNLGSYLAEVIKGREGHNKTTATKPKHCPRITNDFARFAQGGLTDAGKKDTHIALYDFERVVHYHLPHWLRTQLQSRNYAVSSMVYDCFQQYITAAQAYYTKDVSDRSIMILTVLKLWVALDQLVCAEHTIISDYLPEIPEEIIEPLLLRSSVHLKSASEIQCHIRQRRRSSSMGSVFVQPSVQESLPVRFFGQSAELKALKTTIELTAQKARDEKIAELNKLNAEIIQLKAEVERTRCDTETDRWGHQRHAKKCSRCPKKDRVKNTLITPHEWPLPKDKLELQAVIFELGCPESIRHWREMTYRILRDLATSKRRNRVKSVCKLTEYPGLLTWSESIPPNLSRITIASEPGASSSKIRVPATEDQVLIDCTMTFQEFYDIKGQVWATAPSDEASFTKYGTFTLSDLSPYRYLQYALQGTSHSSNQILASQADCPNTLSLHEHYAFGTLRSGPRLQWMNMVRGLEENVLSFRQSEVHLLHTQAAWQVGELSGSGPARAWHIELEISDYGQRLVTQAYGTLDRARENWLEVNCVRTIVMLIARLLASSVNHAANEAAYGFLREARSVTLNWFLELFDKLSQAETQDQVLDYQRRVCEMATVCRSTYDVDDAHLEPLISTGDDCFPLVLCLIILCENKPPEPDNELNILLCRNRRLSHHILETVMRLLGAERHLFDSAVSRFWDGYRPSEAGWSRSSDPDSPWVSTITPNGTTGNSQGVHLNLLDGRLLVNGRPLQRLPPRYATHETYTRVFGQRILDVIPANVPGMTFTTRVHVEKHEVSFGMDKKELIIQARRDGRIYELIPPSKVSTDFPKSFADEYHHWIDLGTKHVEFRPLSAPWTYSETNWHLYYSENEPRRMVQEIDGTKNILFDIHSEAFRQISSQIKPLESSEYLHVTDVQGNRCAIVADLPRMMLSFFVNGDERLESYNFRGQLIDENQSIGTLFGLKNKLILRAQNRGMPLPSQPRTVLVPYGGIKFGSENNHTLVTINPGPASRVQFARYEVDEDLRYLSGDNANLKSRLLKIYLHAATSYCVPDPLTGLTGTEEALYELAEAATSSFHQIDEDEAKLLKLIGSLTPKRSYCYPNQHLIQTTVWAPLPPLAQHYAFCTAANMVFERAHSLQLFTPLKLPLKRYTSNLNTVLLKRAAHRAYLFYPSDTTNRLPVTIDPSSASHTYEGRDHTTSGWNTAAQLASWTSMLAHKRHSNTTYVISDLVSQFELWDTTIGALTTLELTYSAKWLHLELQSSLLAIYNLCREAESRYSLAVCLAAAAYSGRLPKEHIPTLIAAASHPALRDNSPPDHSFYQLSDEFAPDQQRVSAVIRGSLRSFSNTPAGVMARNPNRTSRLRRQRKPEHNSQTDAVVLQLSEIWMNSWQEALQIPAGVSSSWLDVPKCLDRVGSYFKSCLRNVELWNYLQNIQRVLASGPITTLDEVSSMPAADPKPRIESLPAPRILNGFSLERILGSRECPKVTATPLKRASTDKRRPINTACLEKLLNEFQTKAIGPLQRYYKNDLESSREELIQTGEQILSQHMPSPVTLEGKRIEFKGYVNKNFESITGSLQPRIDSEKVLSMAGMWPRLEPRILLGKLALRSRSSISKNWIDTLCTYARSFIEYQSAQRLVELASDGKEAEYFKELDVVSQSDNDPDWLLVQIDGNFRARDVQTKIAHEMAAPSSGQNTVLQLNMGEGKSSVIVPIIAAALADSTRLVRVVVLKPLWQQMFHLLVTRLSGLVGRRIWYLPFSRHNHVDESQAEKIREMYEACMREGGVLLAQPEHILSFKLMGIDRLLSPSSSESSTVSESLRNTQAWLSKHSRDILDESDEILHVRYQLVYTIGEQRPLKGHPERWIMTQQVLSLAAKHLEIINQDRDGQVEYLARGNGQFPLLRILPNSVDTVTKLIMAIAQDIADGYISGLDFRRLSVENGALALRFMTDKRFPSNLSNFMDDLDAFTQQSLLLLRGLLACGIIVFALKDKHHRVDYGLHLVRSLLAVPYRAKDTPSLRAEFGHPDVAVVLTYLSYYHNGLTPDQLRTCFERLYTLGDPTMEYDLWVRHNEATPEPLRQLSAVNLKDQHQFDVQLTPCFERNSVVVDFFLSSVVFPKAAKQFSHKLTTSGWDLAEIKGNGKDNVTTGFSGTKDNSYLLPTSIEQCDPVKQSSTNALVLNYLLQPVNNHYLCVRGTAGRACLVEDFLHQVINQVPEIRVLIDIGAQMLDLDNEALVRQWMKLRSNVAAAVYFDDEDKLTILARDGLPTAFHSSPFSQQLDKCIVYLDDEHTRGTDLRLPPEFRAAVTLGPKITKDRLLQGCMRMRKLGAGQTVMFFAPADTDAQIRKTKRLPNDEVNVYDVIHWALLRTCDDLEHYVSHWARQGVEYFDRQNVQEATEVEELKKGWVQTESRSLKEMYSVSKPGAAARSFTQRAFDYPQLEARFRHLGITNDESADISLDEEQEREVSHEVERERQVVRPPRSEPAVHLVHNDIREFVESGMIPLVPTGIVSLFRPLRSSGLSQPGMWSSELLASVDFCKPLETSESDRLSEYMRPVHWVISGPNNVLIVVSPFEANELLPAIRKSSHVHLHIFAPRVMKSMGSFIDLRFYSTPSMCPAPPLAPPLETGLQLGLFAGQLYLDDYTQYRTICALLGLYLDTQNQEIRVQSNGFVNVADRAALIARFPEYRDCRFLNSPVSAIKELIGYRRKGMTYGRTHVGQLLNAHPLTENDF